MCHRGLPAAGGAKTAPSASCRPRESGSPLRGFTRTMLAFLWCFGFAAPILHSKQNILLPIYLNTRPSVNRVPSGRSMLLGPSRRTWLSSRDFMALPSVCVALLLPKLGKREGARLLDARTSTPTPDRASHC
ncbi:hypothetical protein C8R46DRAFT_1201849 [Mycena filopes]|nr:hypothetical protein C8R46DRAFT_1201849 [Mycena filopes]